MSPEDSHSDLTSAHLTGLFQVLSSTCRVAETRAQAMWLGLGQVKVRDVSKSRTWPPWSEPSRLATDSSRSGLT